MADRAFTTLIPDIASSAPGCPQPTILRELRKAAIKVCERTLLWRHVEPKFNLSPGAFEYGYNKPQNADVHVVFEAMMNGQPLNRLTLEEALYMYPQWADLFNGYSPDVAWSETTKSPYNSNPFNTVELNDANTYATLEELDSATATDLLLQESGDSILLETSPGNRANSAINVLYARAGLSGTFNVFKPTLADCSSPRTICQITTDKFIVLPSPDDAKLYSMRMFYALKPKRDANGMEEHIFDELEDIIVHATLQQLLVMPNTAWTDRELAAYHARQFVSTAAERRARANLSNMRGAMTARSPKFA